MITLKKVVQGGLLPNHLKAIGKNFGKLFIQIQRQSSINLERKKGKEEDKTENRGGYRTRRSVLRGAGIKGH